jgi:hypothetical protein
VAETMINAALVKSFRYLKGQRTMKHAISTLNSLRDINDVKPLTDSDGALVEEIVAVLKKYSEQRKQGNFGGVWFQSIRLLPRLHAGSDAYTGALPIT